MTAVNRLSSPHAKLMVLEIWIGNPTSAKVVKKLGKFVHLHATIVQELSDQVKTYNNTTIILYVNCNFIKYNFTREYLTGWIR